MRKNGYPSYLINQEIRKSRNKHMSTSNQVTTSSPDSNENGNEHPILVNRTRYIGVPYIPGASERIQRVLLPYNIKLSNKSSNTFRGTLSNLKDR